jgi:hypothetical protein
VDATELEPWSHATIYQMDRDVAETIEHLDYLNDGSAESLGVGAILVTSTGGTDEFDRLSREADRRGMKVLGGGWRGSRLTLDLSRQPWGAQAYRQFVEAYEATIAPDDWPSYKLGGSDRPHLVARVGASRARLLAMMQMTLRGLSVIYDGEEAGSMLELYRRLIHLRDACPALSLGDYRPAETGNDRVYGYIRETPLQKFLVLLNFGDEPANVKLSGLVGVWIAGTHDMEGDGLVPAGGMVALRQHEGRMFEKVR